MIAESDLVIEINEMIVVEKIERNGFFDLSVEPTQSLAQLCGFFEDGKARIDERGAVDECFADSARLFFAHQNFVAVKARQMRTDGAA